MRHSTLLEYKNYRYFKAASLLMIFAVMAYLFDGHATVGYGGSWLGYLFGILSTLIIIMLILYGIRKRLTPKFPERRKSSGASLLKPGTVERRLRKADWWRHHGATFQGWLSAHVYFGMALVVLVTLHTGFQFGWNLHTAAYLLLMAVIISGCYGVYAYLRFPRLMTDNMDGDTFEILLLKIDDLDKLASMKSMQFSDAVCRIVLKARQETRIGGNFLQQIRGYQHNCPTAKAVKQLECLGKDLKNDEELKSFNDLYSVMVHKEDLVIRAWRDVMYRARVEFWLYLHAPLSIASLAALIAHIVAIFYYW